ncbi:MAG: hypothetical protein WB777_04275, partial [Mycobacterium sp.]
SGSANAGVAVAIPAAAIPAAATVIFNAIVENITITFRRVFHPNATAVGTTHPSAYPKENISNLLGKAELIAPIAGFTAKTESGVVIGHQNGPTIRDDSGITSMTSKPPRVLGTSEISARVISHMASLSKNVSCSSGGAGVAGVTNGAQRRRRMIARSLFSRPPISRSTPRPVGR